MKERLNELIPEIKKLLPLFTSVYTVGEGMICMKCVRVSEMVNLGQRPSMEFSRQLDRLIGIVEHKDFNWLKYSLVEDQTSMEVIIAVIHKYRKREYLNMEMRLLMSTVFPDHSLTGILDRD